MVRAPSVGHAACPPRAAWLALARHASHRCVLQSGKTPLPTPLCHREFKIGFEPTLPDCESTRPNGESTRSDHGSTRPDCCVTSQCVTSRLHISRHEGALSLPHRWHSLALTSQAGGGGA
eukprot:465046-Prorocentrum_minimum.AAC.1